MLEYQEAQRRLWHELTKLDRTWRISDFITVGTPMYFADRLVHHPTGSRFVDRVARRELAVCPPINDNVQPPKPQDRPWWSALLFWRERDTALPHGEARFAYEINGKRFLHQGAVFSVVRWSNCYFPARLAAFGDVFGGPVSMLFGRGVNDLAIRGNRWTRTLRLSRYVPVLPHAWYYRFPDEDGKGSVARTIRDFLSLRSEPWVSADVSSDDATSAPIGGPQPTAGAGWRLLADQTGKGEPYIAQVALDGAEYGVLWTSLGLDGEQPSVDFDTEIVVHFGAVFSGSCPETRLDDVVIDQASGAVTAEIVQLGGDRICTSDANPRSYLVAIDRSVLPPPPFTVSAYPDCSWCTTVQIAR